MRNLALLRPDNSVPGTSPASFACSMLCAAGCTDPLGPASPSHIIDPENVDATYAGYSCKRAMAMNKEPLPKGLFPNAFAPFCRLCHCGRCSPPLPRRRIGT